MSKNECSKHTNNKIYDNNTEKNSRFPYREKNEKNKLHSSLYSNVKE